MTNNRTSRIRRASWIGIVGNGFLSVLKITAGALTGSLSLLGDGLDSLADITASLIALFTARILEEPPDREHPWGHGRAEIMATRLIGIIMFMAGFQLFLSSLGELLDPMAKDLPPLPALVILAVSMAVKALLALYKSRWGKCLESPLLLADAVNMRNDIFLSLGVFTGLLLGRFLKMPIIDTIMALGLSLYIISAAIRIYRESDKELMDGLEDIDVYHRVFGAVESIDGAENPHRCRIRKIGTLYDIDLDIEVDGSLTVRESHRIAEKVEGAIKKQVPAIYDIMVHVEPCGTDREREQYGLSPGSVKKK